MNDYLLQSYIKRLSKEDISSFAISQGISLEDKELAIIHDYLTKYWRTFYYGNPKSLLEELKEKLNPETYNKLESLYIQAKDKFN